jgi:replication initiation and membrane attachment protein DnaB
MVNEMAKYSIEEIKVDPEKKEAIAEIRGHYAFNLEGTTSQIKKVSLPNKQGDTIG